MQLSEIINLILGGGLAATIAAVITLRSTVKRARAEAEKATAEAETVRIDNSEKATRVLVENIVNPLKEELNETRKDLNATKREMARLRKAIDDANSCRYSDNCPVLDRMRGEPKKPEKLNRPACRVGEPPRRGQHGERDRNKANRPREDPGVGRGAGDPGGQPACTPPGGGVHGEKGTGERESLKARADGDKK